MTTEKNNRDKYYWFWKEFGGEPNGEADTVDECLAQARLIDPEANAVYIATWEKYLPQVDADEILDNLVIGAHDSFDTGHWLDDVEDEDVVELTSRFTKVLNEWLEEVNQVPNFDSLDGDRSPWLLYATDSKYTAVSEVLAFQYNADTFMSDLKPRWVDKLLVDGCITHTASRTIVIDTGGMRLEVKNSNFIVAKDGSIEVYTSDAFHNKYE